MSLNAKAEAEARAAKKEAEKVIPPLEPEFPYASKHLGLDPFIFRLTTIPETPSR